jgi:hypothetical protein
MKRSQRQNYVTYQPRRSEVEKNIARVKITVEEEPRLEFEIGIGPGARMPLAILHDQGVLVMSGRYASGPGSGYRYFRVEKPLDMRTQSYAHNNA